MISLKLSLLSAVFCFLLLVPALALATDYSPGVSVGQWIKYGNISFGGNGIVSGTQLLDIDFTQLQVTAVSGTNVTLHVTGRFMNGTDFPETYMECDLQNGLVNGSLIPVGSFLIAGNLKAGDALPGGSDVFPPFTIERTDIQTTIGTKRNVNVVNEFADISRVVGNVTLTGNTTWAAVYDKASGFLVDMSYSMAIANMSAQMFVDATDTNIFATNTDPWSWLGGYFPIVVVVIVIVVIIAAAALILRRRRPVAVATPEAQEADKIESKT